MGLSQNEGMDPKTRWLLFVSLGNQLRGVLKSKHDTHIV